LKKLISTFIYVSMVWTKGGVWEATSCLGTISPELIYCYFVCYYNERFSSNCLSISSKKSGCSMFTWTGSGSKSGFGEWVKKSM